MSNSFALQEFTIPPRRETRFPLGFSDKSAKKSCNFRCYAQKPSILPRSCPTCWDIIGRAASGGGPGGLTPWWRGQGLGRAALGCGQPLAPLCLIFGLRDASGKIGGSTFISSNSDNISCVAFLKHKNSRKQGTGTVASR
jgi:hypothetical protein